MIRIVNLKINDPLVEKDKDPCGVVIYIYVPEPIAE